MLAQGGGRALTRIISTLNDASPAALSSSNGHGRSGYQRWCWMAFGSEGVRQTLNTDQDNGIVFAFPRTA
jgi:signal-transduction protein with cAMP-binding, CBS, and nucleotidyltransferase domain